MTSQTNIQYEGMGQSSIGPAHLHLGLPCQDAFLGQKIGDREGREYFLGIVSDGAGCSRYGDLGAQKLVESVAHSLSKTLSVQGFESIQKECILNWVLEFQVQIEEECKALLRNPEDYACTLVACILGPQGQLFFQIGDGAIIAKSHNCIGVVFWPERGEYANSTYFATQKDVAQHLQFYRLDQTIDHIALMSDGMQGMCLNNQQMTCSESIFGKFWEFLAQAPEEDFDLLQTVIDNFLVDPKVQIRSDDDKTLYCISKRKT